MNRIKVFLISGLFVFVSFTSAFADGISTSGIVSSLSANFAMPFKHSDGCAFDFFGKNSGDMEYDSTVLWEFGALFGFNGNIGMVLSTELGYNLSSYDAGFVSDEITGTVYVSSFMVGLMQRVNIGQFSLGAGGGIKIPFSAVSMSIDSHDDDDTFNFNVDGTKINDDINLALYIRAVFDYSFFISSKRAVVFGINAIYNFDIGSVDALVASKEGFYIGAHVGFKFSPKL